MSDSILKMLYERRVLHIGYDKARDLFSIEEYNEGAFGVDVTRAELLQLAEELKELAKFGVENET